VAEFSETITVILESVFNSEGFDQLRKRMRSLMKTRDALQKQFDRGIGMKNIEGEIDDLKDKFNEAGLEMETFRDQVDEVDKQVSKAGSKKQLGPGRISLETLLKGGGVGGDEPKMKTEKFTDSIRELFDAANEEQLAEQIVDRSQIKKNTEVAKSQLEELGFVVKDAATGEVIDTGRMNERLAEQVKRMDGEFEHPQRRALRRMNPFSDSQMQSMRNFKGRMGQIGAVTGAVSSKMGGMARRVVPGLDMSMQDASQSVRGLQMRLLGLQFTMLTVAFIFGGLMTSALGAVGVFEVLSNSLKFLFLPSALDVLDIVLDLQEVIFGLDRETRRAIGSITGIISGISIAVGLFAALSQAILPFVGAIASVVSVLGLPLTLLLFLASAFAAMSLAAQNAGTDVGTVFENLKKKVGPLIDKLFEFSSKIGGQVIEFLSKMFDQFVKWFTSADWEKLWGKFFDFVSKGRDDLVKFLENMFSKLVSFFKSDKFKRLYESFFDFVENGAGALSQFLSDTLNGIIDWASNADWKQIWGEVFNATQQILKAVARFTGVILGEMIQLIMAVDWGQIFANAFDITTGFGDAAIDQALPGGEMEGGGLFGGVGGAFMEGFNSVEASPPDVSSPGATVNQGQSGTTILNMQSNVDINGKNQTSFEDGREFVRETEFQMANVVSQGQSGGP
jgi:hypothetical protein